MNQTRFHPRRAPTLALMLGVLFLPAAQAQYQLTGTVTVPTDRASPWDVGSDLFVGFLYSDGTLNIQSGSSVTSGGGHIGYAANGTVNIDGAGSTWINTNTLYLGSYYSSIGQLHLTHGATASATSTIFGSNSSTTQGQISVDGTGSSFTTGFVSLGQTGYGSISVTAGGAFSTSYTGISNTVAENAGSSGAITVSGTGSIFTSASQLFIGQAGAGTMTVAAGAQASVGRYTYLGYQSGSSGTLTVSGTSATYTGHDYIWSGYGGTGTLIVKDGGSIGFDASSTQHVIRLGVDAGSAGSLKIGDGGAAGTVTAAAISGGGGTAQVVFNHTGAVGGGTYVFAPALEGSLSVLHHGPGTTSLTAANTYTGGTTIDAGTLLANNTSGSATGYGTVTVNSGGTLGGSGSVGTLVIASGGTLAPGNSPGTLTAGNTTFAGGGTFQFQLNDANGSAGTNWDVLAVNGTLTLSATSGNPFALDVTSLTLADASGNAANFNSASDYSFTFLTTTGGVSDFSSDKFSIDTSHFSNPFSGTWSVSLINSGHDLSLHYAASAVPEPATYAALAGAAACLTAAFKRRRASGLAARCRRFVGGI